MGRLIDGERDILPEPCGVKTPSELAGLPVPPRDPDAELGPRNAIWRGKRARKSAWTTRPVLPRNAGSRLRVMLLTKRNKGDHHGEEDQGKDAEETPD